jgi:hypothetical protein
MTDPRAKQRKAFYLEKATPTIRLIGRVIFGVIAETRKAA